MYVARDDAGNIGICQFDVVVAATDCPYPAPPNGGNFTIQTKQTDAARKIAFVDCSANHTFIVPVPAFYTCDLMVSISNHFQMIASGREHQVWNVYTNK